MLIQHFLFHCVLGEVKVLTQNFLFHHVLGEVKIGIDPELFLFHHLLGEVKVLIKKCFITLYLSRH